MQQEVKVLSMKSEDIYKFKFYVA